MVARFDGARPGRVLWVRAGANAQGDGRPEAPFPTIGAAVAQADACTAIMVREGTYHEHVKFNRTQNGRPDCPIWLASADGIGKARVIAPESLVGSAIEGGGNENVVVEGFAIEGGKNGIHFGQNGFDWTDLARNIVVRHNIIRNPRMDGVKINGVENVLVADNVISGGTEEGIDFVGVVHGVMLRNSISQFRTTSAGLFAKAGSDDILVAGNLVADIDAAGISVGGYSNPSTFYRPGYDQAEVTNMTVYGNRVERVGKQPLVFFGAHDSKVSGNLFINGPGRPKIFVGRNNPRAQRPMTSDRVIVTDNVFQGPGRPLQLQPGNGAVVFERNDRADMNLVIGPDPSGYAPPR